MFLNIITVYQLNHTQSQLTIVEEYKRLCDNRIKMENKDYVDNSTVIIYPCTVADQHDTRTITMFIYEHTD